MTIENYLAEAGALATLAGLLAGFGISAVIQFLTMDNKSKLVSAAIITFSTSTVMFLYSLIVSILLFAAAAELGRVPTEKDGLATWAFLVIVGAIFVFLTGIGHYRLDPFTHHWHRYNHRGRHHHVPDRYCFMVGALPFWVISSESKRRLVESKASF